jgi:MFS family permease
MRLPAMLSATVIATSLAIYGLRGVYFSVMNEARVPLAITGSAVGLMSVIGYTPDIFAGPLIGYLLDRDPGAPGHRHVFLMVAAFALLGLTAAIGLRMQSGNPSRMPA